MSLGHNRCKAGYVYLIRSPKHKIVKIGLSTNPGTRIMAISRDVNDGNLFFERCEWVSNMLNVEYFLHQHFKRKHVKDEWFNLSPADIREFDRVIKTVRNKWKTGEYGYYG